MTKNQHSGLSPEQQRESDLLDHGVDQILALCKELNMKPSESITIQFRLVLFGVLRMVGNDYEARIAALEKRAERLGVLVPIGQSPGEQGFKP